MRFAIALLLLISPAAARAWDVEGADVAKRLGDLEAAQKGKTASERTADIAARAKQDKAPDWVKKAGWDPAAKLSVAEINGKQQHSGWTVDVDGVTAAFTVGVYHGAAALSKADHEAQENARMTIKELTIPARARGVVPVNVDAKPLDWYRGKNGDLFVLIFGRASPAP